MEPWTSAQSLGLAAFGLGLLFGAVAQVTHFCTLGAVTDLVLMSDSRRMRAWLLAAAVAVLGTQALDSGGLVDVGRSLYLAGGLPWGGSLVGGLLFGLGMTLTGGCGARTLVRLGAGNLKSVVVVLVTGVVAMMAMSGLLAPARLAFQHATTLAPAALGLAGPGLPALLDGGTLTGATAHWTAAGLVGGGLAWWCLKDAEFRRSPLDILGGALIGLLIPAGWLATAWLGDDPFEPAPLESFTFIAPIGDTLLYLMTYTGANLSFGVAMVAGTVAGACVAAVLRREFRLESFADRADLQRHLVGAALMGVGGVLALGCTIGQGLTALSTLALSAPLSLAATIGGGMLGVRRLEEGSFAALLRAWLRRTA